MFGVSFSEILLVALVALVVVGPQRLPGTLRNVGEWISRLRRMTTDMRAQTGIDDILREEGIDGVHELRALLRGEVAQRHEASSSSLVVDPYAEAPEPEPSLEYPVEGADAEGALPDDLVDALRAEESE